MCLSPARLGNNHRRTTFLIRWRSKFAFLAVASEKDCEKMRQTQISQDRGIVGKGITTSQRKATAKMLVDNKAQTISSLEDDLFGSTNGADIDFEESVAAVTAATGSSSSVTGDDNNSADDSLRRVSLDHHPRRSDDSWDDEPTGIVLRKLPKKKKRKEAEDRKRNRVVPDENNSSPAKKLKTRPVKPVAVSPSDPSKVTILAQPDDRTVLSPLHCFVREQIEVFVATEIELNQPAPGRKKPIQLHQVGLRCIHCRHLPVRHRIKRAVCYPSSLRRVYHSVSDFKFDHLFNCKNLPSELQDKLVALREEEKTAKEGGKSTAARLAARFTSSTAKYYHESASKLGLVDTPAGIFQTGAAVVVPAVSTSPTPTAVSSANVSRVSTPTTSTSNGSVLPHQGFAHKNMATQQQQPLSQTFGDVTDSICVPMSLPLDERNLDRSHCLVRRHLEFFTADETSPGRKSGGVNAHQVGIRCVHCKHVPEKHRPEGSVSYPPCLHGIHLAVWNMKRHFAFCPCLPPQARAEFASITAPVDLKSVAKTAQYYYEAAAHVGLVDTDMGVYFDDGLGNDDADGADDTEGSVFAGIDHDLFSAEAALLNPLPINSGMDFDALKLYSGLGI